MDYREWVEGTYDSMEEFKELRESMTIDLERQLEGTGLKLLKTVSRPFCFSGIVEDDDGRKWLHVLTADVSEDPNWFENVSLRRMSSQSDWKGKVYHYCHWDALRDAIMEYMKDEYDAETIAY